MAISAEQWVQASKIDCAQKVKKGTGEWRQTVSSQPQLLHLESPEPRFLAKFCLQKRF